MWHDDRMLVFYQPIAPTSAANFITSKLQSALQSGNSVLWLVPGGSAISIAVEVSRQLKGIDLRRLSVTLTDERFGPPGHADSNWWQLEKAGFFLENAELQPVLTGGSREQAAENFGKYLARKLDKADYSLGLFGIGPDGHTAGILPYSPAVSSSGWAANYTAGNFERITMTPKAIEQLNEAIVYATGEAKRPVLDQLEQNISLQKQPAQALKKVSKLTIFNDYKGERL